MPHGYTGQQRTRSQAANSQKFSQASTRRHVVTYDQHGRPWSMNVENANGMPVGLISPMFSAPWKPDQQYFIINPDNVTELWINYPQMFRDRRAAEQRYHQEAVNKATANSWTVPELGKYDERIVTTIGRPPAPWQPVAAAYQGNAWLLGESDTPDKRLTPYVIDTRRVSQAELDMLSIADFRDGARATTGTGPTVARTETFEQLRNQTLEGEDLGEFAETELDDETRAALDDIGEAGAGVDTDEDLERLLDLEEVHDPEATGGQRVAPQNQSRPSTTPRRPKAQRQAAGEATGKQGRQRPRAFDRQQGRSLADGASPVISE